MKNGYTLKLNNRGTVGRFLPKYSRAQKFLDNEVLKDCDPYVPMRTGNLRNSGIRGTSIGSGEVKYVASYSHAVYYAKGWRFSKDKHPLATAQWFEVVKPLKKDSWLAGVNKIIKGG